MSEETENVETSENLTPHEYMKSYRASSSELRRRFFTASPEPIQQNVENEPPLLEELGIDIEDVIMKTFNATFQETKDEKLLKEADLSGPFLMCLTMGSLLVFNGKIYFGYIYGMGCFSCAFMYCLFNLMSVIGITMGCTTTILGYCMLPMILLCFFSLLFPIKNIFGVVIMGAAVFWCARNASDLFSIALKIEKTEQILITYPCALFYTVFGLLIVF